MARAPQGHRGGARRPARLQGLASTRPTARRWRATAGRASSEGLRRPRRGQARDRAAACSPTSTSRRRPQAAAEVVDVLQVPAFLCRQTDLLLACGRTGKPVNVKKGQFMAPQDMGNVVEKVRSTGNQRRDAHRARHARSATTTSSSTCAALAIMRRFAPVVFDVTHSLQLPGGLGDATGGAKEFHLRPGAGRRGGGRRRGVRRGPRRPAERAFRRRRRSSRRTSSAPSSSSVLADPPRLRRSATAD